MISAQSQSRNYNSQKATQPQNLDELFQNTLAFESKAKFKRKDDDFNSEASQRRNQTLKSDLSSTIIEESDRAIDLNAPQGTETVNMKDEEYESNLDGLEIQENLNIENGSKKQKNEDDLFKLKNIGTGESFDLRQHHIEEQINPDNCIVLKGVPWNTFWKNIRRNNEYLWDATEAGDYKKVLTLLDRSKQEYPAEIDSKALDDWTALHMAANGGYETIVEILLKKEANIEAKTSMSRTPLHISCMRGHFNIIKLLVSFKANINAVDNDFCTPLHYASEHGFADVVTFLLDEQPEITIKNRAGLTCIDVANSAEVREIFEKRDLVNESTISSFGRTYMDDFIFYDSRSDRIGKMLSVHHKMHQMKNLSQDNNTKPTEKNKPNIVNVKLDDWSTNDKNKLQNNQEEKVGPKSFIAHVLLGKGSFGEVYLVEKISNKKIYAMKVLKKDRIVNQNLTRYAKTERNVLSIMKHPFIVGLNYAFQTENKLYLILDYCPGGDLGNAITKRRRFTEDVARIYAAELTLALEALHSKDIIFRDLKPDNVVLDSEGHALLTDFGLSKEGVKEGLQKSFCGSVAYLAPEMLRRAGHNKTVDWYLLGVLIYEMLVGMPPYFSSNRDELFENIKKAQLKLPKVLSEDAKNLITSLLKRDPAKRLGAQNDANEIKNHPWFRDINWSDAFERKLKPPPIEKKAQKLTGNSNHKIDDNPTNNRDYIAGWSFINRADY